MIAWKDILQPQGVIEVAEYVSRMAGQEVDEELASKGKAHYQTYCVVCHGANGKGQKSFGAPDLTNEVWLYGDSRLRIQDVISNGRNGVMPAFKNKLSGDKIHIMAAYVKSLRRDS